MLEKLHMKHTQTCRIVFFGILRQIEILRLQLVRLLSICCRIFSLLGVAFCHNIQKKYRNYKENGIFQKHSFAELIKQDMACDIFQQRTIHIANGLLIGLFSK